MTAVQTPTGGQGERRHRENIRVGVLRATRVSRDGAQANDTGRPTTRRSRLWSGALSCNADPHSARILFGELVKRPVVQGHVLVEHRKGDCRWSEWTRYAPRPWSLILCVYNLLAGSINRLGVANIRKATRSPDTGGPLREAIDRAAWPAQSCTYKCSRSSTPPTPSL